MLRDATTRLRHCITLFLLGCVCTFAAAAGDKSPPPGLDLTPQAPEQVLNRPLDPLVDFESGANTSLVVPVAYEVDTLSLSDDSSKRQATATSDSEKPENAEEAVAASADGASASQDAAEGDAPPADDQAEAETRPDVDEKVVETFDPTAIDLEGLRGRVAAAELPETTREDLTRKVEELAGLLSRLQTRREAAQAFPARLQRLPEQIAELQSGIQAFANRPAEPIDETLAVDGLKQQLLEVEQSLAAERKSLELANAEAAKRATRLDVVRKLLRELPEKQRRLAAEAPASVAGLVGEVAELQRRVALLDLEADVRALEAEERFLAALGESELPALTVTAAQDRVAAAEQRQAKLLGRLDTLRKAELERAARKSRDAIEEVPEPLREFAEANDALVEEMRTVNSERALFERRKAEAEALAHTFADVQTERAGSLESDSISEVEGLELRAALRRLPAVESIRIERRQNLARLRDLQLRQFQIESELEPLDDSQQAAASLIVGTESELTDLQEPLVELLETRRELLASLSKLYSESERAVSAADEIDRQLIVDVTNFRAEAEAAVLWVRSNPSIFEAAWELSPRAKALLNPKAYTQYFSKFVADLRANPVPYTVGAAALFVLLLVRTRIWTNCRDSVERARKRGNTSLRPYVRILLATAVLASFWPAVVGFFGYRLGELGGTHPLGESAGSLSFGVLKIALLFFTMEFIRYACRADGLVELLGQPKQTTRYVRRKVLWIEWAGLPLAAVILVLHDSGVGRGVQLGERLCFTAAMVVLAIFLHKLLRSRSPLIERARERDGLVARYRWIFYGAAVGLPILFALLSLAGYHFAALQMAAKLQQTLWLTLGLLVARLLLVQLVQMHRRRMAMHAMHARANEREASETTPQATQPGSDAQPMSEIGEMSDQLRRLIGTLLGVTTLAGLYAIWIDVLPSLGRVLNFEIYSVSTLTDEGTVARAIGPIDLLMTGLVGVITFTAARNFPGLLEFTVLNRTRLDRSVRYAISTICTYVIGIVGIVLAGQTAGFAWENVQWLAAGLTVGLGFGLQEIFANFISGLIIFLEQPVRVGDIVTLGDVTGSVTRIRIRATTITNWDRKEYIVPNREFITGRLLNWTLSDQTNRVVVNVGVAYGSDVGRVRQIILDVASQHPEVMKDPAPIVTFEEFGDSSLNFVLRCFLPTLENRLATIHELHEQIAVRFAENEIEIPFPQRDLNLRNLPQEQIAKISTYAPPEVA